jgi:ureidoglycolate lyase
MRRVFVEIPVEPLTPDTFAPFGKVIEKPALPADASGPGWQWWGQTALLFGDKRPYAVGYLDLQPVVLSFDWAERHMFSAETLIPLGGDCVFYVGPPDFLDEPGRLPELERFRAFRIRQGQAALMQPGVWHGAPFAAGKPVNVIVLLLQDSGTIDNHLVRFEDTPIRLVERKY